MGGIKTFTRYLAVEPGELAEAAGYLADYRMVDKCDVLCREGNLFLYFTGGNYYVMYRLLPDQSPTRALADTLTQVLKLHGVHVREYMRVDLEPR